MYGCDTNIHAEMSNSKNLNYNAYVKSNTLWILKGSQDYKIKFMKLVFSHFLYKHCNTISELVLQYYFCLKSVQTFIFTGASLLLVIEL